MGYEVSHRSRHATFFLLIRSLIFSRTALLLAVKHWRRGYHVISEKRPRRKTIRPTKASKVTMQTRKQTMQPKVRALYTVLWLILTCRRGKAIGYRYHYDVRYRL